MGVLLRTLLVEDSETDAELLLLALKRGGFEPQHVRVETADAMRTALNEGEWDIVLCDFNLPRFSTPAALDIVAEYELDLPFIVVSGMIQMEDAVFLLKAGAHDFVRKDDLRLCCQRTGDRYPLPLSTREFGRLVAPPLGEADIFD